MTVGEFICNSVQMSISVPQSLLVLGTSGVGGWVLWGMVWGLLHSVFEAELHPSRLGWLSNYRRLRTELCD